MIDAWLHVTLFMFLGAITACALLGSMWLIACLALYAKAWLEERASNDA